MLSRIEWWERVVGQSIKKIGAPLSDNTVTVSVILVTESLRKDTLGCQGTKSYILLKYPNS